MGVKFTPVQHGLVSKLAMRCFFKRPAHGYRVRYKAYHIYLSVCSIAGLGLAGLDVIYSWHCCL
jgi:hypothetical protein